MNVVRTAKSMAVILLTWFASAPPTLAQDLQPTVAVGQEIKVTDDDGRTINGRVIAAENGRIVINAEQSPFARFRPRQQRVLPTEAIAKIDALDSTWNGTLAGAGAALVVTAAITAADCRSSCDDNFGPAGRLIVTGMLFVPVGMGIGAAIDGLVNRRIYTRERTPAVQVAPWLAPGRTGLMLRATF
jgi:hypothetical protein